MFYLSKFLAAIVSAAFLYLAWWLYGRYVHPHPLDNLPGPSPTSLLSGSFAEMTNHRDRMYWMHLAETYGPAFVIKTFLNESVLVIHDPKALHTILIKNRELFPRSVAPFDPTEFLLGPGLLTAKEEQHRRQRKQLNPVFAADHLRDMSDIFKRVAEEVRAEWKRRVPVDGTSQVLDVHNWMARTTLEILGEAGLGHCFDDFGHNSTDAYGESLKTFFPLFGRVLVIILMMKAVSYILPNWILLRIMLMIPNRDWQLLLNISKTMKTRSQEIIAEKKTAFLQGDEAVTECVGKGKDIMSILLKANMLASDVEKLTNEELSAQISIFILAGMDTTSTALSRILHCLAEYPTVQNKLRVEIMTAREENDSGDLSYDNLLKLPYLDAVIRETLRAYAPLNATGRLAAQDTELPLMNPVRGRDGSLITQVPVKRGTLVLINCQGSNSDKAVWGEDAHEWRPERWLEPLPKAVEEAHIPGVYANLMTFLGGSHACIGFKFAELEMKVVLSTLLSAFAFELPDEPITWHSSIVLYPTMGEHGTKPEMLLKVTAMS